MFCSFQDFHLIERKVTGESNPPLPRTNPLVWKHPPSLGRGATTLQTAVRWWDPSTLPGVLCTKSGLASHGQNCLKVQYVAHAFAGQNPILLSPLPPTLFCPSCLSHSFTVCPAASHLYFRLLLFSTTTPHHVHPCLSHIIWD